DTGRDGRRRTSQASAALQRARSRRLWIHDYLRRLRLGNVAGAALVLDHLRAAMDRGAGAVRAGLRDSHGRAALRESAFVKTSPPRHTSRSGKPAAGFRDAVGLPRVLSVSDHLVRQPAGRDPMVPEPDASWMGLDCRRADHFPFLRTVLSSAGAIQEA